VLLDDAVNVELDDLGKRADALEGSAERQMTRGLNLRVVRIGDIARLSKRQLEVIAPSGLTQRHPRPGLVPSLRPRQSIRQWREATLAAHGLVSSKCAV
jgi:hypothetical protein